MRDIKSRRKKEKSTVTTAEKEIRQFAVFLLGQERYAVDIKVIKEIIRPLRITPLPGAPAFLEGVINIRGDIIPVIEMRKRFDVDEKRDFQPRLIIVKVEDKWIGMVVDNVTEVIRVPANEIKPPPRVLSGESAKYVEGVCQHGEGLVLLLNLDYILSSEEKISLNTVVP